MEDVRSGLEKLHPQSYGWAQCCCRRNADRAQDVLQRVYLKVLSGAARHEGRSDFRTWLFGVIRKTAQDEARREWLRQMKLARLWQQRLSPQVSAPAQAAQEAETQEQFAEALAALPARQREVLHLVFYQGLSIAQAGGVMGVSIGAARTHYERGKKNLAAILAPQLQVEHEHGPKRAPPARAVL